ncbi:MAG: TetR/AcrR family transcriptional regulator [Spirochaetota bacterium]
MKIDTTDKKSRIMGATLKLIMVNGFHGTPVSAIADEAGVGAGTIYRYFENKEAIINELYTVIQKELHEETIRNVPADASVRDEFYIKWRNILMYFLNNPYEAKFIEQYSASPYISPIAIEENNRRNSHLRELISRGLASHEIRDVDYKTIAVYMWGTIKQLHYLHTTGALAVTDSIIDDVYSVFWEGIRAK